MSAELMKSHARQINEIGARIEKNMRSAFYDAVKCGELLHEVKESVGHGNFINWIKENLVISERSARNYLDLYKYRDKTATVADLQEAYKQIEHIKSDEKEEQRKQDEKLIQQRMKTGEKPDGWSRSLEYQYKKRADDEGFKKRVDDVFEEKRREKEEQSKISREQSERLTNAAQKFIQDNAEKIAVKEKLKLNVRADSINQDAIIEIIDEYLSSISETSRRIETAQNIIKYIRNLVIKYQQKEAS